MVDDVRREYRRLAATYDQRWASYVQRSAAETLRRLEPRAAERVLDVGCGTGTLLALLGDRQPGVEACGVDLSPEMLNVAAGKVPAHVRLLVGNAESLPFADGSFDAVVSSSVYHYWRRPGQSLAELRRVLRPGGRLVITDWCDDYLLCKLCNVWLQLADRGHYRAVGSRDCTAALHEADFESVRVDRYRISWLWGLMSATAQRPENTNV